MSGLSSRNGVRTAIKRLIELGFISIIKTNRVNKITINNKIIHSESIHLPAMLGNTMYGTRVNKNYIFKKLGGSTWDIYNAVLAGNDNVKDIMTAINKSQATISKNLKVLVENEIVVKNKRQYSINPDLNWNELSEKYNVELEFNATREIVEQERYEQRQRIKAWHYENKSNT